MVDKSFRRIRRPKTAGVVASRKANATAAVDAGKLIWQVADLEQPAPFTEFDRATFLSDTKDLDGFVLALALAFNDMRVLSGANNAISRAKPATGLPTVAFGEWSGLVVWVDRMITAVIYELLVSIDDASKAGLLEEPRFQRAVRRLRPAGRELWTTIVAAASTKPAKTAAGAAANLQQWLVVVRNTVGFHYDRKKMRQGAELVFRSDEADTFNGSAFASLGENQARTRFYFADAVAHRVFQLSGSETARAEARRMSHDVNVSLRGVIEAYLLERQGEIGKQATR